MTSAFLGLVPRNDGCGADPGPRRNDRGGEMLLNLIAATTVVAVSSIALALDVDCRGRPPPERVKMQCCGRANYHALDPSQIHRDADNN
jgi:hypothetical protein